jgi:signal transduction histidine kinase
MALAQKIVVSHDGSIEAANREGGGARVIVTLPLAG